MGRLSFSVSVRESCKSEMLTRGFRFLDTSATPNFEKLRSMNFSGSDLYWVKMSEFYSEMRISSIRALLITLKSPEAQIFFTNFINIIISSEYDNLLKLLSILHFVYTINFVISIL